MNPTPEEITLPLFALSLLSVAGFVARYMHHCQESRTYAEAYYRTENEYYTFFNVNRYASYESFRNMLTYYRKNKTIN